ncbi:MAG: lysozyme [Methanobrevibacter sp.]|nr:lysozyme [Methanobrevibacter sp.]
MGLKISENGLNLIKKFEGCKLTAYQDVVGVWTIGYGHISGVKKGMKITQAQADEYLKKDISSVEIKVNKYYDKYKFNQNQFDALCSFCYNIGSINQLTANGTRSIDVISQKILSYTKAGGKTIKGLENRRKAEKELFDKKVKTNTTSKSTQSPLVVRYFPAYKGRTVSIVTALTSLGINSNLDYRKEIATANGIPNYKGSAAQNTKMLSLLRSGRLIKP